MASQKSSKSLQTNNSQNRTSGDKMNLPKINGELITNTMPRKNMQYLSLYPKRIFLHLIWDEWSNRQIAEICKTVVP